MSNTEQMSAAALAMAKLDQQIEMILKERGWVKDNGIWTKPVISGDDNGQS